MDRTTDCLRVLNHNHYSFSNMIGTLAAIFFTNHLVQLKSDSNWTVGYDRTPVIRQLKQPIILSLLC